LTVLRPNFTDIVRDASDLKVRGKSLPGDVRNISGIVVTLSQKHGRDDATTSPPVVTQPSGSGDWNVLVPGDGFEDGPVAALGIETRTNGTMVMWTDVVEIPAPK
jgi:hypothetical protein